MVQCPYCKGQVAIDTWQWYPLGRMAECPACGAIIRQQKVVTNPKRNRPKHMSKKARLAARREYADTHDRGL